MNIDIRRAYDNDAALVRQHLTNAGWEASDNDELTKVIAGRDIFIKLVPVILRYRMIYKPVIENGAAIPSVVMVVWVGIQFTLLDDDSERTLFTIHQSLLTDIPFKPFKDDDTVFSSAEGVNRIYTYHVNPDFPEGWSDKLVL